MPRDNVMELNVLGDLAEAVHRVVLVHFPHGRIPSDLELLEQAAAVGVAQPLQCSGGCLPLHGRWPPRIAHPVVTRGARRASI